MFSIKFSRPTNKTFIALCVLLSFFLMPYVFATHDEHGDHHEEQETNERETPAKSGEEHGDVAKLSDAEVAEFGIEIEKASMGVIEKFLDLNGEVRVNKENVLHISSRFEGVIRKVNVREGDFVTAGTVLAILENTNNLSSFKIIAQEPGQILFKDAALGEAVQPGKDLFVIADLSNVWVHLGAYQKDIPQIRKGQTVHIVDPFGGQKAWGVISFVAPVLDEKTRTGEVRVTLKNRRRNWKPGMFVTGSVAVSSTKAGVVVPRSALHTFEGRTVVFVRDEDGFEPSPVKLGKKNREHAEILSGLAVDQEYVHKNGFIIKSELGKSEMDGGHSH